ncbi:disaggregatase related repeat-containing protein [Methanosarcina hadiensis]
MQINQALKYVKDNSAYTTVYLKGPFTYVIDSSLVVYSNTILEGDSNAVIKLTDNAGWSKDIPLITQGSPSKTNPGKIVIRGFEIDGNYKGNTDKPRGSSYYTLVWFFYDDVEIYNMYLHDSHNDGLKVQYSNSVKFHDNRIYKLGHEGLYAIKCENIEYYNNTCRTKTNSACRLYNANHAKIHDNIIYTEFEDDAGGPGIQIQYLRESVAQPMNDIEVYNNTIYDTYGPGIWLIADGDSYAKSEASNVYIHHNTFYGCGTHRNYNWVCGIVTSGFNNTTIENNVFDGNYHAAVALQAPFNLNPPGTGYTTILRNNIISNTKQRFYQPSGTGNGVVNYLSGTHSFILENNCFYNNIGGDYKNTSPSSTDIHEDPLFADQAKHDYHLKSEAGRWTGAAWVNDMESSPCVDKGCAYSDYSNEPEDNGDRINIGRYGNTIYASKSGEPDNYVPVMDSIPDLTVETGKSITFTVNASDVDGDSLTYSASDLPSGAAFNSNSRVFSWTPVAGQEGTYSVTFEVSDGKAKNSAVAVISVVNSIAGVVSDNRLREASPDIVYQDATFVDVGGMNNARYRDVMWFNLNEYTNSSEIGNATLSLYWYYPAGSSRPSDTVIEVYRPASAWNSNYVSWNNRDKGIAWKNAGGDWYDKNGVLQGSTPYATITIKGSALPDNKYYELDVTDLVKEYIGGKYVNTGFFIKARNENNNYIAFYSNECGSDSKVPKLNITKKTFSRTPETANVTIVNAADNRLREASPSIVYNISDFIDVGGMNNVRYRDVMWFDLNEYTGSTDVSNATLSLYWYYPAGSTRPSDTVIEVYRPASAWNSSYVSWNNREKGIAWKNAGGDWYDKNGVLQGSTPYATITIKGSALPDNKYYGLDVTDLVKEYTGGKYANTGFFIKARNENNNYIAFYSNECGSDSKVPKLQLVYTK